MWLHKHLDYSGGASTVKLSQIMKPSSPPNMYVIDLTGGNNHNEVIDLTGAEAVAPVGGQRNCWTQGDENTLISCFHANWANGSLLRFKNCYVHLYHDVHARLSKHYTLNQVRDKVRQKLPP